MTPTQSDVDDAVHIRIGVLTLCHQDPDERNCVEAVHWKQADCWGCQAALDEIRRRKLAEHDRG